MHLRVTSRRLARSGETLDRCADTVACEATRGCFAVADGVSAALLSEIWSHHLCDAALRAMPEEVSAAGLERWLAPLRGEMTRRLDDWARGKPWNATLKAAQGSSSTLLLGQYAPAAPDPTAPAGAALELFLWNVGDSNLLHATPAGGWCAWPATDPDVFGNRPPQLSSLLAPVTGFARTRWRVEAGDLVVVATDAVASWLLAASAGVPAGDQYEWLCRWVAEQTVSEAAWAQWVTAQRANGTLADDDSSVLVLEHLAEPTAGEPALMPLTTPVWPTDAPPPGRRRNALRGWCWWRTRLARRRGWRAGKDRP